ncbi:hypothetical protein [Cerasicoccus frondis]|uniref:hypothetical protein n=1 Tax=Cerasicoccus frondis TaxID=490090 RepID=UPI002852B709|nr:hypothetical protein [Cerasicoccus frondis]
MGYENGKLSGSDYARGSVDLYISLIKKRMQSDMEGAMRERFSEQSILVTLVCLRKICEEFPDSRMVSFPKREFYKFRELFEQWYIMAHDNIPINVRSELRSSADKEFGMWKLQFGY